MVEQKVSGIGFAKQPAQSTNNEVKTVVRWLVANGYPALPVAPYQDPNKFPAKTKDCKIKRDADGKPTPAFTGKNPSYLDRDGNPRLINHNRFQDQLPTREDLTKWFANPANGVGTLGGWNDTYWIDPDLKDFDGNQEELDAWFYGILNAHEELQSSWWEKTHSGGFRLAVKLNKAPGFTNFALEPGGKQRGQVLGAGRFTVLAPTIGPSGTPYINYHRDEPVRINSLENLGIYPVRQRDRTVSDRTINRTDYVPGALRLEDLGNQFSKDLLQGKGDGDDRSAALTRAAQEWYGWENFCRRYQLAYSGTTEDLASVAWARIDNGQDAGKWERILKTINPTECHSSSEHAGGNEEGNWLRILKLDRNLFEQHCPEAVKQAIKETRARSQQQAEASVAEVPAEKVADNTLAGRANRLKLELQRYLQEPDAVMRLILRSEVCATHRITKQEFTEQIIKLEADNHPVKQSRYNGLEFFNKGSEALNFLISRFLPAGESILLSAPAGVGKTNLLADMIYACISGGQFLDEMAAKECKVLFISCDESEHSTIRRLKLRGVDMLKLENFRIWTDLDITNLSDLEQELEDWRPDVVFIDSVTTICMNVGVSEKDPEFARYLYKLKGLLSRYGASGVLTHHANKDPLARGINKISGSARIPAAFWGCYTLDRVDQQNPANPFRFLELVKGREVQEFKIKISINQRQEWGTLGIYSLLDEDGSESEFKSKAKKVIKVLSAIAPKGMEFAELNEHLRMGKELYRVLDRMEESRQITRRRSSVDRRRWVYAMPESVTVSVQTESEHTPLTNSVRTSEENAETLAQHEKNYSQNYSQTILNENFSEECEQHCEEIANNFYSDTEPVSDDLEVYSQGVEGGVCSEQVDQQSNVTVEAQSLPKAARPQGKAMPPQIVAKMGRFKVGDRVALANPFSAMAWVNNRGVQITHLYDTVKAKLEMIPEQIHLNDLLLWDEYEEMKAGGWA